MPDFLDFLPSYKNVAKHDGDKSSVSDADLLTSFYKSLSCTENYKNCKTEDDRNTIRMCGLGAANMFYFLAETDKKPGISKAEYEAFSERLKKSIYYFGGSNIAFTTENKDVQTTVKLLLEAHGISYKVYDKDEDLSATA